ncbi:MAG: metalloregulator ArsR/SmtB family transcription factor [Clostridium sp.]|nr:metalloregulator ArsR/SmtB family transcription factor [Clostridium sp.]
MLCYEPIPLFEANIYLSRKAAAFSTSGFYERLIRRHADRESEYEPYFKALTELYSELDAVEIEKDAVLKLFTPLMPKGSKRSEGNASDINVCSILFGGIGTFIENEEHFFDVVRQDSSDFPTRVAYFVSGKGSFDDENFAPIPTEEVFRIINESSLSQSAKLTLIDAILNAGQYIDLLERTLPPIAARFSELRELWLPLLEPYRQSYPTGSSVKSILDDCFYFHTPTAKQYSMYPSVIDFQEYKLCDSVGDDNVERCSAIVGVLYPIFVRNSHAKPDGDTEVSRIMSILGEQTRFNIMVDIAKNPTYGREIANRLGLAPCTVSHHLNLLMGCGLIVSDVAGKKAYYSINREKLDWFFEAFRRLMYGDEKSAEGKENKE